MQEEISLQMGAAQEAAKRLIEETQIDKLNQVLPKNSTSDPGVSSVLPDPAPKKEGTLKDRDVSNPTGKSFVANRKNLKGKKKTQTKRMSKKHAQTPSAEQPVSLVKNNIQKMEEEIERQKMQALVEYKPQTRNKEKEYAFFIQKGIWKKKMEQQPTPGEKKPKSAISSFNCLGVFRRKNRNKNQ